MPDADDLLEDTTAHVDRLLTRISELEAEVDRLKKPPILDGRGGFWCKDTRDAFHWGQIDAYAVVAMSLHLPPYDETTQTRIRNRCSQLMDFYMEYREVAEKSTGATNG